MTDATAFRYETRRVADLTAYAKNARVHSPEQIAQIAASIREYGFTNPILVDGADMIIAGHGRLAGAKQLEFDEVPVLVLDHLTEDQKRAYILSDNKIALNGTWDERILREEVAALLSADIELIGFDVGELESMFEGTDFSPELQPTAGGRLINATDVAHASQKMLQLGQERAQADLLNVMCPHCAGTFQIAVPEPVKNGPNLRPAHPPDAKPGKRRARAGAS